MKRSGHFMYLEPSVEQAFKNFAPVSKTDLVVIWEWCPSGYMYIFSCLQ